MSDHKLNRITAIGVFLISAIVYFKTLSVTVVFWDVGEFIASAVLLQVPHPPGSPLFILIGRLVSIVPFMTDIAARVHSISAISSALTIMFLYLISVKVLLRVRGARAAPVPGPVPPSRASRGRAAGPVRGPASKPGTPL